ncbi:MAG: hypothetical protein QG657_345 [Acidobacteriota bacterium]|nr:hypothetical protein [Acidobacteriota bacterium]
MNCLQSRLSVSEDKMTGTQRLFKFVGYSLNGFKLSLVHNFRDFQILIIMVFNINYQNCLPYHAEQNRNHFDTFEFYKAAEACPLPGNELRKKVIKWDIKKIRKQTCWPTGQWNLY